MTMYVVMNAGKQIHEQNHYISFVFLFPIYFFHIKIIVQKGTIFKRNLSNLIHNLIFIIPINLLTQYTHF